MQHIDRRTLLRGAAGAALALALPGPPAMAGRQWCKLDPTFRFIDTSDSARSVVADVLVATEDGVTVVSTGPIELAITLPVGITAELVSQDAGLGDGYAISIVDGSQLPRPRRRLTVVVAVRVPATNRQRIRLEFVPNGVIEDADAAEGWTNEWINVRTRLRFLD